MKLKTLKIIGIAGASCLGGVFFERFRNNASPAVEAAEPNLPAIPPEPGPGYRPQQIMRFGYPTMENVKQYSDFVVAYDRRIRGPQWVFEHITKERVKYSNTINRENSYFFEAVEVHPFFRALNEDYKGSGFDRGHMAAAGNHRVAQEHMNETFVLSNISPQVGDGFNRHKWNQLERHVRNLTKYYKNVYICTGPLFIPRKETDGKTYVKYEVIGQNHVAVPTHFFKVLVCETEDKFLDLEAYILENKAHDDKVPLNYYLVPPDNIERHAGFLLFDRIPRNFFRFINGRQPNR